MSDISQPERFTKEDTYKLILSLIVFYLVFVLPSQGLPMKGIITNLNHLFSSTKPVEFAAIFIGLLTFSVPFLWNAYQRILDVRDKTLGDNLNSIITKEFYNKSLRYFTIRIQTVVVLFLALCLIGVLFFYPLVNFMLLVLALFYFAFLPQIYNGIVENSSTNLKDYITDKDPENSDTVKVFNEIWQFKDELMEKEFSIKPNLVFQIFQNKIKLLITRDKSKLVLENLQNFLISIPKRSTVLLSVFSEVLPNILEIHYLIWSKSKIYIKDDSKLDIWAEFNQAESTTEEIIKTTIRRVLSEQMHLSYSMFRSLEGMVKQHISNLEYIEEILRIFYTEFFEKVHDSVERYDIWNYNFPLEWKVTKSNLESGSKIPYMTWINFYNWIVQHGFEKEDFDPVLEDVSANLFPDTEPTVWSKLLLVVLSSRDPNNPMASLIEHPWNFGFIGRTMTFWGSAEDPMNEQKIEAQRTQQLSEAKKATYDLAHSLPYFASEFTKEKLQSYITELEKLEGRYKDDEKKEYKRQTLLEIFKEMLRSIGS